MAFVVSELVNNISFNVNTTGLRRSQVILDRMANRMNVINNLSNTINFNINQAQFNQFNLNEAQAAQIEQTTSALDTLTNRLRNVGLFMTATFTTPFIALNVGIAKSLSTFEQLDVAFETMLGSAEKGKALLEDLFDLAKTTPFTIQGVTKSGKQMLAMGIEADKLVDTLTDLGNVAAGVGGPNILQRLAFNLGQVKTIGKLTGRELRDFANAGVPLVDELAKNLSVSKDRIAEMVSAGLISFPMVEAAFKSMGTGSGKFSDLMIKQSKTLGGLWSNLQDVITLSARSMNKLLLPVFKRFVMFLTSVIQRFESLTPRMKRFTFIIASIVSAIGPLLLVIAGLVKAFIAIKAAAIAANIPLGLFVLKFALIGAAIVAVIGVLALIIEDFIIFQRGGNSAIGFVIDKFKEFRTFLEGFGIFTFELFMKIGDDIKDAFSGAIDFVKNIFIGEFKRAFGGLVNFVISMASLASNAMLLVIQPLLDVINFVTGSKFNISESANLKEQLKSIPLPDFAGGGTLGSIGEGISGQRSQSSSVNLNSTVNLTFPAGTNQSTIDSADLQLRKAMRDELQHVIRETAVANPVTQ